MHMEEFIYFLHRAGYVVGQQQTPIIGFFRSYQSKDVLLNHTLLRVAEELERNCWESGESAWQAVLSEECKQWNLSTEQWECLWGTGRILWGGGREEIQKLLLSQKERLEEELAEERHRLLEQQKIVMPVGMMAGVMLILLLL